MNKEEQFQLAQQALSGINRVVETFESLAPQGDALLNSETRVSDDDALFYGRVSSALALLRASANRLILLSGEMGLTQKLIDVRPLQPANAKRHYKEPRQPKQLPTDDDDLRVRKRRNPAPKGAIPAWILKRLGRSPSPILKADLVRQGVAQGFSDPSIYHNINMMIQDGRIQTDGNNHLYVPPPSLSEPGNE